MAQQIHGQQPQSIGIMPLAAACQWRVQGTPQVLAAPQVNPVAYQQHSAAYQQQARAYQQLAAPLARTGAVVYRPLAQPAPMMRQQPQQIWQMQSAAGAMSTVRGCSMPVSMSSPVALIGSSRYVAQTGQPQLGMRVVRASVVGPVTFVRTQPVATPAQTQPNTIRGLQEPRNSFPTDDATSPVPADQSSCVTGGLQELEKSLPTDAATSPVPAAESSCVVVAPVLTACQDLTTTRPNTPDSTASVPPTSVALDTDQQVDSVNQLSPGQTNFLLVGDGQGRAPMNFGSDYSWIMRKNDQVHRDARLQIAALTGEAVEKRGYNLNGATVKLQHVDPMLEGTCLWQYPLSGSAEISNASTEPRETREGTITAEESTVLNAAMKRIEAGKKVVALNAASGFHIGGGVETGGRHALEEATCIQTSLLPSLKKAAELATEAVVSPPEWVKPRRDGSTWHQHIPGNGCVWSPHVEIFRSGTLDGYPFLDKVLKLEGIISVAMPNCNDRMRDSPVDKAPSLEEYKKQIEEKWLAVLEVARNSRADCLILCDAGCGVFGNQPRDVGEALGKVLKEFRKHFEEIVIAAYGALEFKQVVKEHAQD